MVGEVEDNQAFMKTSFKTNNLSWKIFHNNDDNNVSKNIFSIHKLAAGKDEWDFTKLRPFNHQEDGVILLPTVRKQNHHPSKYVLENLKILLKSAPIKRRIIGSSASCL